MKKIILLLALAITTLMNASAQNLISDGTFETTGVGNFTLGTAGAVDGTYTRNTWGGVNSYTNLATELLLPVMGVTTGGATGNCGSFTRGTSTPGTSIGTGNVGGVYLFQRLSATAGISTSKTYRLSAKLKGSITTNASFFIRNRATTKYAVRANFVYNQTPTADTYACIKAISTTIPSTSWTTYSQDFVFSNSLSGPFNSTTQPSPIGSAPFNQGELDDLVVGFYTTTAGATLFIDDVVLEEALPAPAANAATGITTNSFTASWAAVEGAASYQLDVSTSSTFATLLASYNNISVSGTSQVVNSGLSDNTTYYYRVRAVSASLPTSDNSSTITVATTADPSLVKNGSSTFSTVGTDLFATIFDYNTPRGIWGGGAKQTGDAILPTIVVSDNGANGPGDNCIAYTRGTTAGDATKNFLYQRLSATAGTMDPAKLYKLVVKLKSSALAPTFSMCIKMRAATAPATVKYAQRQDWVSGTYPGSYIATCSTSWTTKEQVFSFAKSANSTASTATGDGAAFTPTEMTDLVVVFYSGSTVTPYPTIYIDDVQLVEYIDTPTGIPAKISNNFIVVNNRQITINDYSGESVSVYSATGQLVVQTNQPTFNLDRSGLYIVKMGNKTQRVIVK